MEKATSPRSRSLRRERSESKKEEGKKQTLRRAGTRVTAIVEENKVIMKKKLLILPLILGSILGVLLIVGWAAGALGFNGGETIYTLVIIGVPVYIVYRLIRRKHAKKT